jgi:poly(3-hydroxybutyrate) depolymerase
MHVPILGRTTRDISATRTIAAFFLAHPRIR